MPAIGTMSAEIFATFTPISHAPSASVSTVRISRSVAPAARIVRTALIARSTEDATSPTFSCAWCDASRTRRDRSVTVVIAIAMTITVSPSSTASRTSIAMSAPMNVTAPPTASTRP